MLDKTLPRTLFGRMVLIIMLPMILVQIVTILVFYERHWNTVTRYMSTNLAADIAIIADHYADNQTEENFSATRDLALKYFYFGIAWDEGGIITPNSLSANTPFAERMLHQSLMNQMRYPFSHDLYSDPDLISITIQFAEGVMTIKASRKRIFSSTSWLVILWTVSTSVLFFAIALVFIRGQVRPIRRLAKAARQLGLGRPVPDFKLEGAREVRLAGMAFHAMRQRILRQAVERTEMLAGVSHDLRTPLTRLKLQLAYLPESADRAGMESDINEMDAMISGYINFASNAVIEEMKTCNIVIMIEDIIEAFNLTEDRVTLNLTEDGMPSIQLRERSIRRALENIISNAVRYGEACIVTVERDDEQIQIIIDDDGPGIPKDQRISVLRPFVQLNRDKEKNSGVGLGLSIANDAVLAHGGLLLLGDAPEGGLRVRIQLPL